MAKSPRFAERKDIESAVGLLVEYLKNNQGTDMIIRLDGGLADEQLRRIEQGILLVTGRKVELAYAEIDEEEGHYGLLGIVDEVIATPHP